MKKMIFIMLIAFLTTGAFAQKQVRRDSSLFHYGVRFGNNFNPNASTQFRPVVGAFAEVALDKKKIISLSLGLEYSRDVFFTSGMIPVNLANEIGNVTIPLLANFSTHGFAFKIGIQPGFNVYKKGVWSSSEVHLRRSLHTLNIPVGISYCFDFGLILDARCLLDAYYLFDSEGWPMMLDRTAVYQFSVGYRF